MPTLRAFIIEDNPVILESLVGALEEMSHVRVVGHASDEVSAVNWMRMHPVGEADLFIVDVFLLSGTGLGVLRAARELGMPAHCVVLTNYATEDMRQRCLALGAERVFDKSYQLDDLLSFCAELGGSDTRPAAL